MSVVVLSEETSVTVQCADRQYLLYVGDDEALYIEEVNQSDLSVLVADAGGPIESHGQWVNISVPVEEEED
jgi:hypothetical protein